MRFRRIKKSSTALDISPLIDVVLQLLIFFMLSSTFMSPSVQVALPEAYANDISSDQLFVTVTATADGRLFVNRAEVSSDGLLAALRGALATADGKTVTFRGDGSVPYQTVVHVIDTARRAGASSFDMAHDLRLAAPADSEHPASTVSSPPSRIAPGTDFAGEDVDDGS